MRIKINGAEHRVSEIEDVGGHFHLILEDGTEFLIFEDELEAGDLAREYYENMSKRDLIDELGQDTLISWGLCCSDDEWGFSSFDEWLTEKEENPAEHWACDGRTYFVELDEKLSDELDMSIEVVAYKVV